MRRPSFGAWVLAFTWCAWAAFAGALLQLEAGGWAPDLVLLLLASVVAARGRRAHLGLAACAACARSALSMTSPLVLLSAMVLAFLAARAVASVLDREGFLGRVGIAGAAALTFHGWRALACASRGEPAALEGLAGPVLVTTLLAPVLLPVLVRLPGLRPFTGRRA
jgi:hypothetical protein